MYDLLYCIDYVVPNKIHSFIHAYMRKFRSSRKLSDEPFKEWGIRARRLFERWMSSDIMSANAICERMIMEQILDNTSPDLQLWLREHEPKTVDIKVNYIG